MDGGIAFFSAAAAPGLGRNHRESPHPGWPAPRQRRMPGAATGVAPNINAKMIRSDIRITLFLVRPARMGYGAIHRRPDLLGIFPQRT